jgi:crotonobetainyl-CoA:carnitine CoA-transferase CaiB-like acyl-CoA transferase
VVGAGFRFEHGQPVFRGGVPRLGEHTAEVLAELGFTAHPQTQAGAADD